MKLSMINLSFPALLAFLAPGSSAAPSSPAGLVRRDCSTSVNVVSTWTESAMTRRRVAYGVSGDSSVDLASGGSVWTSNNAVSNCVAINNNQQTYFSDADNSWVIDFNEVAGPAGDSAADCLVSRFRDTWQGFAC